ncbi:MAG TPA: 30S ribosomal protein S2 [Candidatus Udaeobacter sp.]|nr:30S ribosomal protein S2 [Candidatus Udaeobacter sp.]
MSKMPTLLEMLKAGVHFGHQKSRWHPKMEQYIFGVRNGVHIIDLEKTQVQLEKALDYVKNLASKGQVILFVGTKRQAREITKAAAVSCEMPYLVERWIGGLLTNFDEVKRRLKKYHNLKEQFATGEIEKYTKKEQVTMKKQLEKLDKYLIGLTALDRMPDALFIADMRTEKTALAEAERTEIPTVAISDTNVNPEKVNYAIPANDDAVNSIKLVTDLVAEAINEGRKEFEKKKLERAKEEPVKRDAVKVERRALKKDESV